MAYRTILVHADESSLAHERFQLASRLALEEDAHLIGVAAMGMSGSLYRRISSCPEPTIAEDCLTMLRQRADQALDVFENTARQLGVNSLERRLISEEPALAIGTHARYADLTVVSQTSESDPSTTVEIDFPETVAMQSGAPVLVLPVIGSTSHLAKRILVGWNASAESRRALHFSLPLLQRAASVHIAIFNAEDHADLHGQEPGADIALYLARQGVKVEVVQRTTREETGSALLGLADDLHTELLVVGCYGHSRYRETWLGGVTRTVLRSATLPLLMAH